MSQIRVLFLCLTAVTVTALVWSIQHIRLSHTQSNSHIVQNDSSVPTPLMESSVSDLSIPSIIHHSWKTSELPTDRSKRWHKSWRICFPDWKLKIWSDKENRELVRIHYNWFLTVFDSMRTNIQRADVSRYFYMFHYGGVYTDLDNRCLKRFDHLLKNQQIVFSGMTGLGGVQGTYVQNSFMASRPKHPFWLKLIVKIWQKFRKDDKARPEFITGPYALMDEIRDLLNSPKKDDVKIYPAELFNPFSWYGKRPEFCNDLGRMTDEQEEKCVRQLNSSYIVQFHVQSWNAGKM